MFQSYQGDCSDFGGTNLRAEGETNLEFSTWRLVGYVNCELLDPALDLENQFASLGQTFPLAQDVLRLQSANQRVIDLLTNSPSQNVLTQSESLPFLGPSDNCFTYAKPDQAASVTSNFLYWQQGCAEYFANLSIATNDLAKQVCSFEKELNQYWDLRKNPQKPGLTLCELSGSTVDEQGSYIDERLSPTKIIEGFEVPDWFKTGGALIGALLIFNLVRK